MIDCTCNVITTATLHVALIQNKPIARFSQVNKNVTNNLYTYNIMGQSNLLINHCPGPKQKCNPSRFLPFFGTGIAFR